MGMPSCACIPPDGEDWERPWLRECDHHKEQRKDAERYRWLRAQHWSESAVAVVSEPKQNVRLGVYCPSGELLDEAIDAAMKVGAGEVLRAGGAELPNA